MDDKKRGSFWKRHGSNIILIILIALFILPQTRKPLQVGLNRLIAFSPSEIAEEEREVLKDYAWNLRSLSGEKRSFEDTKGKVTVLNFWATWCPPCIAEMPSFQKIYNDYEGKIEFLFVSSEEEEALRSFMNKKDYDLPVYQPISVPPELLQNRSLPTTYVISRSGEIAVEKSGSADWNSNEFRDILDELLKEEGDN